MFYTLFVLLFGVYIGQEYPQIPSVKSTFNIFIENLNKLTDDNENESSSWQKKNDDNTGENGNPLGNENVKMRFGPIRRPYYSLPIWISNWWSGSLNSSNATTSTENDDCSKKLE